MKLGTTTLSVTTAGRPRQQAAAGGGGGAGSGAPVYDHAYDGFFSQNKAPLNFSNASFDHYNSTSNTYNSLDTFIDHNSSRIYGAYNTAHYYHWAQAGFAYTGNANFYQVGTRTTMLGHSSAGITSSGRGITIAYLGDQTPVIVISKSSGHTLEFFSYPNTGWLGRLIVSTSGSTNPSTSNDMSGLAFDGTNLLMMNRAQAYMWAYQLPANVSGINGGTISAVKRWSMPSDLQYGLAWTGDGVIMSKGTDASACAYVQITDNGFNGTSNEVRIYDLYNNNYSVAIDYKNRKLVIGGYSNNRYQVYGE
tara:strand:+ start:602 stop:1522 length:921 start_codon:yes stop_codon:yes gene_type:complete